jgi:hypothetical protein
MMTCVHEILPVREVGFNKVKCGGVPGAISVLPRCCVKIAGCGIFDRYVGNPVLMRSETRT